MKIKRIVAILIVAITVFSTSIYAFAAGEFTIVFNANGGSGTMYNQKIPYGTATPVNANQFKRSGYIFRGWNVQREDGTWNTEKLHGGDEGWRKSIPNGYHKTLYKNGERVATTARAGTKVTFYAVWEGSNDKFSTFNRVNIQETSKSFNSNTNPMYKSDNQFWAINSKASYSGFSTVNTGVYNGAIALAIIDNMLNGKYDKTFNKYHDGNKTIFSSIGYTYSPSFASYQAFIQAIYNQITRGYPVPIKVKEPSGHAIYAVAYGILSNKGRPNGKIIANDIAIIDTYSGSWRRLDEMYKYTPDGKYEIGIATWDPSNLYTLGEETYSFKNFSGKYTDKYGNDHPSECFNPNCTSGGHCFGMSITSGGYYHHFLDLKDVSSSARFVHDLPENNTIKKQICYYQAIQGSYSLKATVAGGAYYKTKKYNISSDWNEVINYVKNHAYDNKGTLQIGFRKSSEGGHAINFLRYSEVNGQQRIYAYDNNCPTIETYFYKGVDGKIYQAPKSTFSGAIDCIALRDVNIYYNNIGGFDSTHVIYAKKDDISISGASGYPMDAMGEYVMYEIPEETANVKIKILNKDDWEFEHNGVIYSEKDCSGSPQFILSLVTHDDTTQEGHFEKPGGFFGWLKEIIYKLFGWMIP